MAVAATPVPRHAAPVGRTLATRLGPARLALCLLAVLVAFAGIATANALLANAPRTGLLVTGNGRVLALIPGGPAAADGLQPGDRVGAVDGSGVSGLALWMATAHAADSPMWLTEGGPQTFAAFPVRATAPWSQEIGADVAALIAALLLWLSGLATGLRRRGWPAARLYALAALALALALCALVARDGGALWPWPVLAPAALAGLAALLLAHLALVGPVSRRARAGVTAVAGVPAAVSLVGFVVPLPDAATIVVGAGIIVLAVAAVLIPLAAQIRVHPEPRRRELRVAFLAAAAGLLPCGAWAALALFGRDTGVSPLWAALALALPALLYGLLFGGADTRRLDRRTRMAAAHIVALAVVGAALARAATLVYGPGWIAAVAVALLLFAGLERVVERLLERTVRRPCADYPAALRLVEDATARTATPVELAVWLARDLPAVLAVRSAVLLLRGLDCPPDAYHLVDPCGCTGTILDLDPALVATSLQDAQPIAAAALEAGPAAQTLQELGVVLWVPLWWGEAQRGVLALGPRRDGDSYREEDVEGIDGLAGLLALSLHTQQLVGHLHERTETLVALNHRLSEAHEQERAHLSRELHDVVAQELIALTRQLRRYGDGGTPPPPIWADMLAAAQDALTATRRICNGLRPAILDLGLAPALRDLVAETTEQDHGPEVSLSIEGAEQRLAGEVEFALFRVAQEGLNNALHHAGARQVRVEALFNGGVRLRVRDDGHGFVVPRRFEDLPGDHLGLIGMRERLAQLGGTLTITSMPGRGTVLEASAGETAANR